MKGAGGMLHCQAVKDNLSDVVAAVTLSGSIKHAVLRLVFKKFTFDTGVVKSLYCSQFGDKK